MRALRIACLVLALVAGARADEPLAPYTVVVFNKSIPESEELARFYAQKRGIARDHLVGITCSHDEEISRTDYDRTIAEPLRQVFRERKWWTMREGGNDPAEVIGNTIKFVALIKGMPLKIKPAEGYPGDQPQGAPLGTRNDASVDSEVAVLGRVSPVISGIVGNPFFQSYRAAIEGIDPAMMLVCRLDAPNAATVRRMITDAIETEKTGLWGRAYVDGAHNTSGGLALGDDWLRDIVQQLHKTGIPVVYDDAPPIFPDGYPMSDCALYYGWYAGGVAGPFTQPDFKFLPGAIAVHIHSFSASTLRDPNANWVGPLLSKGAAASLGNVYEPYLQLTTNLSIFNDRLLHGFTFAESAYMGTQALSWMGVMVGDPLYRPFGFALQFEAKGSKTPSEWRTYRDFALQNSSRSPEEFRELARETASRGRNAPMIEDIGLIEAQNGNYAAATSCFQQARSLYTKRDDILRVVLEEADAWVKWQKPNRGLDLVRSVLKIINDAPSTALLRKIEHDLSPPSPGALPTTAKP
ncbi:MAG: TIGR03790 family protein [Verrucomicrobiota bacterium]|nr:TIGR03790 family protein [Verrucomicrobiota bacterium]